MRDNQQSEEPKTDSWKDENEAVKVTIKDDDALEPQIK